MAFAVWMAVDVALRGPDRRHQGGALLTAAAIAGLLGAAAVIVGASGPYPQGLLYKVAIDGVFWLGPIALAAGVTWMVRGFRSGPGDRGEAVWGLYLAVLGMVLTPAIFITSVGLWICTGDC